MASSMDSREENPGGDIGEEAAETLKTAWHENLVLLFRDQQLDDDALLRASQIFGPLQEGGARVSIWLGIKSRNSYTLGAH